MKPRPPARKKKQPPPTHGGARAGAGRKPTGREPMTLHVHGAVRDFLRWRGGVGEYMEKLILEDLIQHLATSLRHSGESGLNAYENRIAECLAQVGGGCIERAVGRAEASRRLRL